MIDKKTKKLIYVLILVGLALAWPSIYYLIQNHTVAGYEVTYSFFADNNLQLSTIVGVIMYVFALILMFIAYLKIVKNSDKFLNLKNMLIAGLLVGLAFGVCFPNTSSDLFYYMGSGRVLGKYGENPYYVTPAELLKLNPTDTILANTGIWSNIKIVYGPVWIFIASVLNKISFNSITVLMYLFKLCNLACYLGIAVLLYKLSHRKKFVAIFLFNPLILLEFLVNCHNDVYMIFFILLGIYFIKNKKNIWLGLISFAISAAIKYIVILILPFFVLYYLRDKKISKKILWSIVYIAFFLGLVAFMYLPWFKNFGDALNGIFAQQGKAKDSIYSIIMVLTNNNNQIASYAFSLAFFVFIYYWLIKIMLQAVRENSFRVAMKNTYFVLMFTIFLLLTNLTSWYLSWLFIPLCYLKSKNIKNIMTLSLFYELTYTIFYITHSDAYIYNMWVLPMICRIICYKKIARKIL